ncbi:MAG: ATP-binding protein [Elusimicrobia bacterium]|nr:ATP-binding protein [Elusimicrobiota bacterium]
MKIRLFPKFLAVISLVSLIPIVLLGNRLITMGQLGVKTAILELHLNTADKISNHFESFISGFDKKALFIMSAMSQMDWENKQTLLSSFVNSNNEVKQISIISNEGNEVIKVVGAEIENKQQLSDYSKDKYFLKAVKDKERVLQLYCSENSKDIAFYYPALGKSGRSDRLPVPPKAGPVPPKAGPVPTKAGMDNMPAFGRSYNSRHLLDHRPAFGRSYNSRHLLDHRPAFVIRILVNMKQLSEEVENSKVGKTGFAIITDSSGIPTLYPKNIQIDKKGLKDISSWPIVKQALKSLSLGSLEYEDSFGNSFIGSYSPLPSIGGAVIVKQSKKEAYDYALFMKREAFYLVLLFVIIVFIVAYLMSRQLARPIMHITKTAEYVAAGNFNHKVIINSHDELMDLAKTFNRMISRLKKYSDLQVDKIIKEQSKIEAILFSIEDGIIMTDYNGNVQIANRKARSVLSLSKTDSLEGKSLLSMIRDAKIKDIISEVFDNPKENFSREIEILLSNSSRFFKCFSLPVVTPNKSDRMGLLIAVHDITLEKEILRIKDEFLHSITHDLRNPMGAIKGFVEFLLKELPGPITVAQRKMLISIDRASFRLLGMINNMLDIAKMEAGKMDIKIEKFSVGDMASRAIDLMESLGKRKKIKFEISSDGNVDYEGDSGLIERVFVNLIGNAIKFTPEEGIITIGFKDDEKNIVAYVQDTGDGIPSEYVEKIFDKFEQVKGQNAGGTGLGLTISKHVVTAHLGKIWAESEMGKGAKFIFSLPKNLAKDENGNVIIK